MNRLLEAFVRRPVLAIVASLAVLLIGGRAALNLPIQQYPRIESASIIVQTMYIGASAELVRGFITTPIERAVASVTGIDYVESQSVAGMSTVMVRLKLNANSHVALTEVGARLDQIRGELPADAEPPTVNVQRADRPFASFYISYKSDRLDRAQLTEWLTRAVQPVLSTVPGVQRAEVGGGTPLAMRIWLDPERMAALGVSAREVWDALRRNNYLSAIGKTEGQAAQVDLLANTDLRSAEEFADLIVRQTRGATIRLKDLAEVELGAEEASSEVREKGELAVFMAVWTLPGVNELEVADALYQRLAELEPSLPVGVKVHMSYDGSLYMRNALRGIFGTLGETVAIVALVVFLFLGSLRTALVPLVAIPISLVGATIFMYLLGFSLNLLTMLAIVLSVGLVVDDAIVVVENVQRLTDQGMNRLDAALASARQLFSPLVSMTITLAAVYAPIGFLSGLTGVLFKEFAFTLAMAVIMSGVVALVLSPVMSAYLVRERSERPRLAVFIESNFQRLRERYARLLDATLEHRNTTLAAGAATLLLLVPLFMLSPRELAPTEDQGEISLYVESAPDASVGYTAERTAEIVRRLLTLPEASSSWESSRRSSAFGGIELVDYSQRKRSAQDILPEAFRLVREVSGVRAFASLPGALPGAGQFDVELVVTSSDDIEHMLPIAQEMVKAARSAGRFMFADTDLKVDISQANVIIDRNRVADLGLDLTQVGQELGVFLGGAYVNRFNLDGRSYKVIPQMGEADRRDPSRFLDLKVLGPGGQVVPVSSFARIESGAAPRSLNRFQQRNSFKINGGIFPGITKDQGLRALEEAAARILPPGYTIDYAGESRQIRTEGATLSSTLAFAVVLIYLVLTAQFGTFRDPLVILLASVPLALTSALVFTFLEFTTINIFTQVGLITLVGLIAKNGILIVEFANKLREAGMERLAAIREASLERLRPVLMTTAATVFGHLPLVLVSGPGAAARNSIGIVLVSGMAIGTLFTLLILPAVYLWLSGAHEARPAGSSVPGRHDGVLPLAP